NRLAYPPGEMLHEMSHEQRNVFRAFTQRRDLDGENIQPVVEVATKMLLGHHPFQVAMGRRHKPSVDSPRSWAPQALEFPLLQNAQQFWLEFQGDITDFVQKQRALVRQLQPATLLCDCTGEGTPLVPEKFTLQQTAGNGSAVEFDQRSLPPAAAIVNSPCNKFLAGAGLSQQEHRRVTCGNGFDQLQHLPQSCTLTDD